MGAARQVARQAARRDAVALIADCHLGGPGGGAAPLLAQLDEIAASGCRRLVLLGDVFHIWVARPAFETPEVAVVVPALAALRRRGVRVDYVEGNRDFFLERSPYAAAFDSVGLEVGFEAGGKRYLAVHGDGLNDRDHAYRFWRWLSKSGPSRLGIRVVPRALARRMVASTEARLARTNFKHKARIPEEPIRAYAARRLAEGFDVLLLGHFHEPHTWQVAGGEVRLLDAWFRSRRVEWLGS